MFRNRKETGGKPVAVKPEASDFRVLLEAIREGGQGSLKRLEEPSGMDPELTAAWNALVESIQEERRSVTLGVNRLMEQVTRMDSVRDMIRSVEKQTESLESMVANSEELNASIEDVSKIAQEVAGHTSDTSRSALQGARNMEKSRDFVVQSFGEISVVNQEMEQVREKTHSINEIIDIVREIADQTNLLALNAAIEAARAGEAGRGFAVVADEVRKLAEHTKESVQQVQTNIQDLQKAIDSSVTRMNSTSGQLDSGKELVEESLAGVLEISESVQSINDTITQVAANTEEQSAVTETFSTGIVQVSGEAELLTENCQKTASLIYETSRNMDALRLGLIRNREHMSDADMISVYKTDHLIWRWKVYNMLMGFEKVDMNAVGNYRECRLGKWYYGIECEKVKHLPAFREMEKPHMDLHGAAKSAAEAYNRGDMNLAWQYLGKMDEASVRVFGLLEKITAQM